MPYTRDQLEGKSMTELVDIFNSLEPTSQVSKFRDKASGIERIIQLQALVDAAAPANDEKEDIMNSEPEQTVAEDEVPAAAAAEEQVPETTVEEPGNAMAPGSDERNKFVAEEATEETKLTNRKEEAIFHGANPNGLVAKAKAKLEADGIEGEDVPEDIKTAIGFFENNATKKIWPTKSDVKTHKEVLVGFLS
jgi:hypothetical protein